MGVRSLPHASVIPRDCARILCACALVASQGLLSACEPPQAPAKVTVSLRLQGNPADATVVIDDEDIGPLAVVQSRGVALPPGKHHISVTAPGYFPWDKAVEAKPGDPLIRYEVALTRIPD
jgi:hypothetical protein